MDRRSVVFDLVELRRSLDDLIGDLKQFPWDGEVELVALTRSHIASVLQRFCSGELSGETVEVWANTIEFRDDVAYDPDSSVGRLLHELANPIITEPLTRHRAMELLAICQAK